jgi:hypothetical protein
MLPKEANAQRQQDDTKSKDGALAGFSRYTPRAACYGCSTLW